jgi:hypothetical protein
VPLWCVYTRHPLRWHRAGDRFARDLPRQALDSDNGGSPSHHGEVAVDVIRAAIIDDHPLARLSLARILADSGRVNAGHAQLNATFLKGGTRRPAGGGVGMVVSGPTPTGGRGR